MAGLLVGFFVAQWEAIAWIFAHTNHEAPALPGIPPLLSAHWTAWCRWVEQWTRPYVAANPMTAYPCDGVEAYLVTVSVPVALVLLDLWALLALVRLARPRWMAWCTPRSTRARVGVAMGVALVGVLFLEGVLRHYVAVNPGNQYRPHPLYFWRLPSNANGLRIVYPEPLIHTNRSGFRGDDIPYEKEANELRILFTGDSITFGQGVDQRDTLTAVLERMLQARYRDKKITVINGAMCGYSIAQSYYLFEEEGLPYHPDLVVVGSHKWNFTPEHQANCDRIAGNRIMRRLQVWAHQSLLYLFLRKEVARSQHRRMDLIAEEFGANTVRDEMYVEYCRRFLQHCRERGMSAIFVAPLPQGPTRQDAWHRMLPFSEFPRLLQPGDRVSLMEWVQDIPEQDFILSPQDHHLSVKGHATIARQFYEVIVRDRLLEP